MISFKQIPPKDFNKSHNPKIPKADEIKSFKKELSIFLSKALSQKEEEFQKNEINKFLNKIYGYDCNTKGRVDSAIYVEDKAQVLIEVKSLNNNLEFPKSQDNPLSKALYESILYFLREHEGENNNSIKHIIVCNPCEFYIFNTQAFRIFLKDKTIEKIYKNCDKNKGVDTSTNAFYTTLESYLKTNFDKTLQYTYFRLDSNLSEEALSAIYTLLSPQVLLDQKNIIDANTLNKGFYEELLYILGLQEVSENGKSGGKILITPSTTKNTLSDTIRQTYPKLDDEAIFTLITTWNNRLLFLRLLESMLLSCQHIQKPFLNTEKITDFSHLSRLFFGVLAKKQENRNEEDTKLFGSIPYLNSSLFDRIPLEYEGKEIGLLASNALAIFSRSILKKNDRFKNKESLPLLDYLFEFLHAYDFTTTAKDIQDDAKQNHDLLINSAVLGLVFEKLNGYKEGSFYTPSFITSYMCKESITQAVIEKFNSTYGWECDTLEELQDEMLAKGYAKNKESYLATLLSIRICDPAVGSGHFLVSALNEMIKICYDLRLIKSLAESSLSLENDEILIYTQDKIHQYIKPTSQEQQTHQIQVELFHLKKSIIENCLFGVDINPNSCEITKLRLWIELLKYSYYLFDVKGENTNALETLPNIDINIKCGNSLISYFDLKQSLTHYPNIKSRIQNYKQMVSDYKKGLFDDKTKLSTQIQELFSAFKSFCFKDKFAKEIKAFQNKCDTYRKLYGNYLAKDDKELSLFITQNPFPKYDLTFGGDEKILQEANQSFLEIRKTYDSLYNLSSNNPFEWRFAFPEVLDSEGNFLGFDCVIGNPPYISAPSQEQNHQLSNQRKILSLSKKFEGLYQKWDLYIPFIEFGISQLCKENAICSMIVPYPLTNQTYGKKLREMLTSRFNLYELTDLRGKKIFESAVVENCIVFIKKQSPCNTLTISGIDDNLTITQDFQKPYTELIQDSKTQVWNTTQEQRNSSRHDDLNILGDFCYISVGMVLHADEKKAKGEFTKDDLISDTQDEIHCKPYIEAKDFEKYRIKRVRFLEYGTERCPAKIRRQTFGEFYQYPKIVFNHLGSLSSHYIQKDLFFNHTIIACVLWKDLLSVENKSIKHSIKKYSRFNREEMECLSSSMDLKYILGITNSKYAGILLEMLRGNDFNIYPEHIRNLPIPKITKSNQATADKIIALVEKILTLKESNPKANTQDLEKEIDSLVYTLYDLSDDEIKLLENKE